MRSHTQAEALGNMCARGVGCPSGQSRLTAGMIPSGHSSTTSRHQVPSARRDGRAKITINEGAAER
jgi:hypothetical protein